MTVQGDADEAEQLVSPVPAARRRTSVVLGTERVAPSLDDPVAARVSTVVGGPVGRHALVGRGRFLTPLRVVLLLAVVFLALGWGSKAACLQQTQGADGVPVLDWHGSRQYVALCYSDTVPLYGAERLDHDAFPYKTAIVDNPGTAQQSTRYMEYPVLTGLYQWGSMKVTKAWVAAATTLPLPSAIEVVVYFTVVALGLAIAWLVTVWATVLVTGRRVWDAALVAGSPLVAVHAFTNFDPLATALAATGLLAWSRKRPVLAGVLLGLGGAAKLYPLLLLGPLLVLCVRTGRMGSWGRAAVAAALAWGVVNGPVYLLYPEGWGQFLRLNTTRGQDPDSLYNVVTSFTGWTGFDGPLAAGQTPTVLNEVSLLLFVMVCAAVGWLALTAQRRPRVAQLCFLVVAGFLVTNKVWSPQYSLWLVPLAVLALPRTRLLLAWMVLDALVWVPRMYYYLGTTNKGLPQQFFTGAVVLRDVAVLVLCAVVVREVLRPEEDLVRAGGVDDPVGGVLDGAPDAPPPWLPPLLRPRAARPVREPAVSAVGAPTST